MMSVAKIGGWREALLLAVVAAVIIEVAINVMEERTLWHRLDNLEQRMTQLETIHQDEQLQQQQRLRENK